MTAPCLPPHPFILAHLPPTPASRFLFLSQLLLFLVFQTDTSHTERTAASSCQPPRVSSSPGFSPESLVWFLFNTLRVPEQRETVLWAFIISLGHFAGLLYFLFCRNRGCAVVSFPCKRSSEKDLIVFLVCFAAHQQCRLHRSSGNWWHCSSGKGLLQALFNIIMF